MIEFKITKPSWGSNHLTHHDTGKTVRINKSFSAVSVTGDSYVIFREEGEESDHGASFKTVKYKPFLYPEMKELYDYEDIIFVTQEEEYPVVDNLKGTDSRYPTVEEFNKSVIEFINSTQRY